MEKKFFMAVKETTTFLIKEISSTPNSSDRKKLLVIHYLMNALSISDKDKIISGWNQSQQDIFYNWVV